MITKFGVAFAHPTEYKIWSFGNLREGWHFGEGAEFLESDLRSAIALHSEIIGSGLFRTDAFPGLGGEIQVTVYGAGVCAEFTLESNGKWTYVLERGNEEKTRKELLSFNEVCSVVKTLPPICGISELFHGFIGTNIKNDSEAWPSSRPLQTKVFPYLKENAHYAPTGAFADISEYSTCESPEIHQYSGSFPRTYFQRKLSWCRVPFQMETRATGILEA